MAVMHLTRRQLWGHIAKGCMGIHYSLVIMVWGTLFPEWSGDTKFSRGIHYSLGNNVWGIIRYSRGYGIHSDTGHHHHTGQTDSLWKYNILSGVRHSNTCLYICNNNRQVYKLTAILPNEDRILCILPLAHNMWILI